MVDQSSIEYRILWSIFRGGDVEFGHENQLSLTFMCFTRILLHLFNYLLSIVYLNMLLEYLHFFIWIQQGIWIYMAWTIKFRIYCQNLDNFVLSKAFNMMLQKALTFIRNAAFIEWINFFCNLKLTVGWYKSQRAGNHAKFNRAVIYDKILKSHFEVK